MPRALCGILPGWILAPAAIFQHPPAPCFQPSLSSPPLLPISGYLLLLTPFYGSCLLPGTPPAPFPTGFPALVGGCTGLSLLGTGCVGAG